MTISNYLQSDMIQVKKNTSHVKRSFKRINRLIRIINSLWLLMLIYSNAMAANKIADSLYLTDIFSFKRISQVAASPEGKQIAFITFQAKATPLGKQWEYSLYLKDQRGNLTLQNKSYKISSLSWSPDGKLISYLAKGNTYQSVWLDDPQKHSITKLIEFQSDIVSFKWSPNGKSIAFVANDAAPKASNTLMPIDVSKNFYNARLYLATIQNDTIKNINALTSANFSITIEFVDTGFDWSPDSQSIVYAFQPRAGAAYANESKIGIINLNTLDSTLLPYTKNHTGQRPLYSPDGKWIAFRTNLPPKRVSFALNNNLLLNNRICVSNVSTFTTHCLSNTFNENPFIIGWNASSKNIFVLDFYKTEGPRIYSLDLNPTILPKLISSVEGFIEPLTITLNNSNTFFGFGYETITDAPQAYISAAEPFRLLQISHFQDHQKKPLGNVRTLLWQSTDKMVISGLLITPPTYNPKQKYPLFVNVHGGPFGVWSTRYLGGCEEYGEMIDPTSCRKNLLARNFIILLPNPRGSGGYGVNFRLANFKDLGGGDYRDIMAGVDKLIQRGIADPQHLMIGGWSYGGYMTTWIISHNNQFKAAVEGAGNIDLISYSATTDIPWLIPQYLGNYFWNNNQLYTERSPIFYVKNIKTPLLILQGLNDIRNPPSQSYELFTALKLQHKPVKMLGLPQQEHIPTNANIIYQSVKEINEWLTQDYTKQ